MAERTESESVRRGGDDLVVSPAADADTHVSMRCWKGGCREQPTGQVHAQWTLVDFDDFDTCYEHSALGMRLLGAKLVDGAPPFDVWSTWWDPGAEA